MHRKAIAIYGYIDKWWEERPPSETQRGGIRSAVVQSPAIASPTTPELVPRPRDRRPSRRRCRPPLPPARAEPRPPPPRLVPSGLDTRSPHPCQEFREPPCPPLPPPPDDDNDADNRRSVDATMDPPPEDDRPQATQSTSSSSPPPTTGGGGGAQNTAPCHSLPGSCRHSAGYLRTVIPRRRHRRRGIFGAEAEVVVVARRGGSAEEQRRGDNAIFCCASSVACGMRGSNLLRCGNGSFKLKCLKNQCM